MFSMKNAALVGIAAADRTLFAPVAAPYGQVTTAYEPAVAGAYATSADAMLPVQPVEFVQPEPQGSDSQTWLLGVGALALVGAAAARSAAPSSVAALDEDDIESARIATLAIEGRQDGKKKAGAGRDKGGFSLTKFLMSGRKGFNDGSFGELELLSGATRRPSDDPTSLSNRFKIKYDTRDRVQKKRVQKKVETVSVGWRSKKPDPNLYPK